MAITIKNLQTIADTYANRQYIYSDLSLDIAKDTYIIPGVYPNAEKSDIKVSLDYAAITNSLTNLFNTLPGQRFLFPDYGLDFRQFLFTPITEFNARTLGNLILNVTTKYEPRVKVINVNIQADPDNSKYNISLILGFPTLNTTQTVNYALNLKNQSFIILPTTN